MHLYLLFGTAVCVLKFSDQTELAKEKEYLWIITSFGNLAWLL